MKFWSDNGVYKHALRKLGVTLKYNTLFHAILE